MKKIRVGTLFSGIGAFEWALKRLNIDHSIEFACDNGDVDLDSVDYAKELEKIRACDSLSEMKAYEKELYKAVRKTNYVEQSYKANYDIADENYHYNVCLLDGNKYKGKVDILVGGSPCQSFSMMGYQKGLEDARGTLFYEYARLVKEIEPKVFIYENVQGLLKHDKGNTWEVIRGIFDSLGYHYTYAVLNSKDYGIPQNRNRLFVVGFKDVGYIEKFSFPQPINLIYKLQDFLIENCDEGYFEYGNVKNGLFEYKPINKVTGSVDPKHFLSDKVFKHVMAVGTKNYVTKPKTDLEIARPLLATMHKMHRAGVDNYVTIDGKLRRLTTRECLRLMGFGDDFKQVVSDTQLYHQAGNSIVSDIFIHIFPQIINTGVFEE
ncbi:MAG: DNA (cytosine-5-)-methyltransferase [Erysipelotrichaceae bacterium]|nr:DNA (cytosine-5-)-methyltransferase [Erysipelotrichaceae bacterium]